MFNRGIFAVISYKLRESGQWIICGPRLCRDPEASTVEKCRSNSGVFEIVFPHVRGNPGYPRPSLSEQTKLRGTTLISGFSQRDLGGVNISQ